MQAASPVNSDDPALLDLAKSIVVAAGISASSEFLHIVRIDSWFGDRWYSFAGKLLGIAGIHDRNLKVPPFHPHRVLSEMRYRTRDLREVAISDPLHTQRTSAANVSKSITKYGESITFAWISANTQTSGRGAIMAYSVSSNGSSGWYAGLEKSAEWRVTKLIGISRSQWDQMSATPVHSI